MTEGEIWFYLREIYSHWSETRISEERLAELEAADLIERSAPPIIRIRLTSKGARQKDSFRWRKTTSTLKLVRTPESHKPFRSKRKKG